MFSLAQLTSPEGGLQVQASPITADDLRLDEPAPRAGVPRGLYIHIPFCVHKCHYCDFYSLVDTQDRQSRFTARLIQEIRAATRWLTRPLETIFVGGGTPTLLGVGHWTELLAALRAHVPVASDLEHTVEANPETVTAPLLDVLVAGGVNRISVGAQSFHQPLLLFL